MTGFPITCLIVFSTLLSFQQPQSPIIFPVVSVKPSDPAAQVGVVKTPPDGLSAKDTPLSSLISLAYGLPKSDRVLGLTGWARNAKFDIETRIDEADRLRWIGLTYPEKTAMLQKVLEERFQLKVHFAEREFSQITVTLESGGSRMGVLKPSSEPTDKGSWAYTAPHTISVHNMTMRAFCDQFLGLVVPERVVDHTGLTGKYDFLLQWDDESASVGRADLSLPTLVDALREQLGLKLSIVRSAEKVVVVVSVQQPNQN